MTTPPPALFSPRRRAAQLARHQARASPQPGGGGDIFAPLVAESLADRLAMVTRRFAHALLVAPPTHPLATMLAAHADRVSLGDAAAAPPGTFDLIIWPGGLEAIDDVPGALVAARRALMPDGLLLGALVGDGSLPLLRRLLVGDGMRAVARLHPQIDLKTFGNLLQRAGFALPVADVEAMTLRYRDWRTLVADLRAAGLANQMAVPPPPLTRAELAALDAGFAAARAADGRADEMLRFLYFTGWAPHPDQPQPARRGSATGSLAAALKAIGPGD